MSLPDFVFFFIDESRKKKYVEIEEKKKKDLGSKHLDVIIASCAFCDVYLFIKEKKRHRMEKSL
jgi:hypothetical protein